MTKILSYVSGGLVAVILVLVAYFRNRLKNLKTDLNNEKTENARKESVLNIYKTAQEFITKGKTKQDEIKEQGEKYETEVSNGTVNIVDLLNDFNDGV